MRRRGDRRLTDTKVEEERRLAARRAEDIEKLKRDNPEFNLPLES